MGHIAAKCPDPQKKSRCSICSKVGHEAKDCRVKVSSVAQVDAANTKEYPPIMKTIELGGKEFSAFVDTGSDHTLIRESAVPSGSIRQKSVKRLQGFGGSIVEPKECILTSVKTERSEIYIRIHILPDDVLPYDVLIGRDLLCSKDYEQIGNSGAIMQAEESAINFNISADVSSSQRNEVSFMLHRYTDCFAEDLSHIGRGNTTVMDIEVTTATPILGRRYQVAFSKRDALRSQLDLLLKHNIISKSTSPYASSAILVPKANGESRLCIDYRALNAVTVKKRYPMPIVEEQLAKLSGNSYFTTLDMTSGYYQIPMGQESKFNFTTIFIS